MHSAISKTCFYINMYCIEQIVQAEGSTFEPLAVSGEVGKGGSGSGFPKRKFDLGAHRGIAVVVASESPPSYEAILKHHGIAPAQMQRQCSDEMIWALVPKMTEWRTIRLGVDKGKIDAIEKDATDEEGKRRKYLEYWKQTLGHKATCERLARGFVQSGRADLADAVCDEVQSKTVTTDGKFCSLKINF